jgi:hypothetical protein
MRKRTPTPVLRRRYDLDGRSLPLGVWILALVLMAAFVEVWQVTRVSQLALETDRAAVDLAKAEARRDDLEARLAATRTRTALEAHARRAGMKPAEPGQIIVVPDAYLAGGGVVEEGGHALVALGRRVAETLVPSARARTSTSSVH